MNSKIPQQKTQYFEKKIIVMDVLYNVQYIVYWFLRYQKENSQELGHAKKWRKMVLEIGLEMLCYRYTAVRSKLHPKFDFKSEMFVLHLELFGDSDPLHSGNYRLLIRT